MSGRKDKIPPSRVREVWLAKATSGSHSPAKDTADELGISQATVHRHIDGLPRAERMKAGSLDSHRPLTVHWGEQYGTWKACVRCHVEWPCDAGKRAGLA